jgi:hypothetical protein
VAEAPVVPREQAEEDRDELEGQRVREDAEKGAPEGAVGRGVAVAGWQWCHSKEQIRAVRMIVDRRWQWQYWQRYRL